MTIFRTRITDEHLDALLSGLEIPGQEAVGAALVEIRRDAERDVGPELIDSFMAVAADVSGGVGESVPAVAAGVTSGNAAPRTKRRLVLSGLLSGLVAKILLGSIGVAAALGGLAATQSLPDPAQSVVADVFGLIGLDLPHPAANHTPPVDTPATVSRGSGEPLRPATSISAGFRWLSASAPRT